MDQTPDVQTPAETPAPTLETLSAPEYRKHREEGTSLADIAKARTPAPDAAAPPSPEAEASAPARDDQGRFAPAPKSKEGNPRYDPRARIDELTRKNADALRRAEAAEAERETYRQKLEAYERGEGPKPKAPEPPTPAAETEEFPEWVEWSAKPENDGKSYERYLRDAAAFDRAQEAKAAQAQTEQATREKAARDAWQTYSERRAAFAAEHPDFESLIQRSPVSRLEMPPWIGYSIIHAEQGPALQYYLLQHPDDARRLASLDQVAALRELGKIEAKLSDTSAPAAPTATAAPTLPETQAAPPLEAVGASASASSRNLETVAARGTAADYRRLRARE